jgi:hypothetical protein
MLLRTAAVSLASFALIPAAAQASTKPHYPKYYSGSLSGSIAVTSDSITRRANWTVSGVRFKLVHVRFVENTWTGYYNVDAGRVSYHESVTQGDCSYTVDEKFALKGSFGRNYPSTPFFMTRDMLGRDYYDGLIQPAKKWTVTQVCTADDPDGTAPEPVTVEAPNLFDSGEKHQRIGSSLEGKYVTKDDYTHERTTYKWSLRPRR